MHGKIGHNHIKGSFYKYCVEDCWHVLHVEKMLYDQGQFTNVYLDVFSITRDAFFSFISYDILDYFWRDMIGSEGAIFPREDADSAKSDKATRKNERTL